MLKLLFIFTHYLVIASAFSLPRPYFATKKSMTNVMMSVPLELEGQLNPSKVWEVKLLFNGKEKTVLVPEDESILEAGEKVFEGVNSSCRNGVCTTCSGQVVAILTPCRVHFNIFSFKLAGCGRS